MISCILLSAGHSSRFGSPKALAKLHEKTVITRLQEDLVASFVDEVIVVLGACAENIQPFLLKHKKVKAVYNKDYNFGQTSSVQAGIRFISQQTEGIMVLPVDLPLLRKETIDELIDYFYKNKPLILIPSYQKRKGHPPVFHASLKEEILGLSWEEGLNRVAQRHPQKTHFLPVEDKGTCLTFNTPEEFEDLLKI